MLTEASIAIVAVAWAVTKLAEWGSEKEATRMRHAEMSHAMFRKEAAKLRGDEAVRHLNAAMHAAWREKENIRCSITPLRDAREELKQQLRVLKRRGARGASLREVHGCLHELGDAISEQLALVHQYSAFILEAKRRRLAVWDGPTKKRRAAAALDLDMHSYFRSSDVPVEGRIVRGVVCGNTDRAEFELDCRMAGRLAQCEAFEPTWRPGQGLDLFVESTNYREGVAVVSHRKAAFLADWKRGQRIWAGLIVAQNDHGAEVDIGPLKVFVHGLKRSAAKDPNGGTKVEVILTAVDDKLRRVKARRVPRRKKRDRSDQHRPARPRAALAMSSPAKGRSQTLKPQLRRGAASPH